MALSGLGLAVSYTRWFLDPVKDMRAQRVPGWQFRVLEVAAPVARHANSLHHRDRFFVASPVNETISPNPWTKPSRESKNP